MASKTPEGQAISEMSQAEGGPTKGSITAQMQSEITKQKNAEQTDGHVAQKLADGAPISDEEARYVLPDIASSLHLAILLTRSCSHDISSNH